MAENDRPMRGPGGPGGPRGRGPGPGGPFVGGEKAKDFRGTIKKLISYIGKYRLPVLIVLIFAVASTIFTVVGPKVLARATTELFSGLTAKIAGTGSVNFQKIGRILLTVLLIYGISAVCGFVQHWIMSGVTQKVAFRIRKELSEKIGRMPMKYFESRAVGDVLSRITNDIDMLSQGMNQSLTMFISSLTSILGVLYMMLTISPLMTLIALVILPVSAFLVMIVVKKSQKYFKSQQKQLGKLNGTVEEVFSGQTVIKAFNREEATLREFRETNDKLYASSWKSQFLSGLIMPIMTFVGNLGYVSVAISGCILAAKGTITVGDIQAFISYVRNFTQPITQLAQVSNMMQAMAAGAERVFEFLAEEEEAPDLDNAVPADHIEGDIRFSHVHFGYKPDVPVIHDWSCDVKKGQTVAIVGPTGAGKTTMVKLLMRFYDVDGGKILVDGHDIREYRRGELRRNFGMVLQDTWLFKGTIMENLRYGRLDATDEEIIAAAKAAYADPFIRTLPGGYTMELNEEATNVSQGQKQLLTITRAFIANSPVLIFDEATSSVDTRTEQLIQSAMKRLMKGKTSFVIAHRLSTVREADLILVMRDGDIVEQGTHGELLAKNGFYAELYNSQFDIIS
jgi:ATP-binding cassette subfamily B multidrug efflux pump